MTQLTKWIAIAVALVGTPVEAGEVAAPDWTGFYVGVNLGGGWGGSSFGYAPNDPQAQFLFDAGGRPSPASLDVSGALGGVQVGYHRQVSRDWLIGVEADFDGSGVSGAGATGGVFSPYYTAPFNAPIQQRIDWFGTVRARLGYLPTGNLLVYGTAGFAYGRLVQSGSWDTNVPFSFGGGAYAVNCAYGGPSCFAGSSRQFAAGWTAGGGVEYALRRDWTVRAEYLYVSLAGGSVVETVLGPTTGALPSSFTAATGRTNLNVARVGLSYQFR